MSDLETEKAIEFVNENIGKPYKTGSMGLDTFDCWGLVRHAQKVLFNIDLQEIAPPENQNIRELIKFMRDHPEHKNWVKVDKADHGCIVEMTNSQHPHHVGIYLDIDGGGILHCALAGVTFDPVFTLSSSGWRKFIYYKHIDKA